MTELLTAAQMRAIEQAAIDSGEVTGLELMERAGQGVVAAIFEEWPELDRRGARPSPSFARTDDASEGDCSPEYFEKDEEVLRAVVLCGPGNNGGDGFVVARLLKERGWAVQVFLYGDPERLPPDAKVNYERWVSAERVKVRMVDPPPLVDEYVGFPRSFDLLVDALFGTGLVRPFQGVFTMLANTQARHLLREKNVRVLSIDLPTGLCSDSGRVLGHVIPADLSVSFHREKVGHKIGDGPASCGKVRTKPIGLEQVPCDEIVKLTSEDNISPAKTAIGHKYSFGHALVLTGGSGATGAARLAARGALRIGAGLVTLGVPPSAQLEVASQITALMLQRVEDGAALADVLSDDRLNALCLGPGLGLDRARDLVPPALESKRAVVLDADALTAFADASDDLFSQLHENCVLTPHGGEFARLFPEVAEKLNATPTNGPAYSKVDATREAARRAGCVVLFKGPDTVIAAPDGRCSVNSAHYDRAAPWLATAGSGDVLAGFITGLLARGFAPMQAAETAAWLHVECALEFGPGLIAEDLSEQLPKVFRKLGL